jgi:putative transposase
MPPLLIAVFAALRCTVQSRLQLEAEILALRHQLAVLQRQAPRRPRLGRTDRMPWVFLSLVWPNWRRTVQIVTPDTVVRWHRRGFALYWWWKSRSRRSGRPASLIGPRPPGQDSFVERVIGSPRRDCLDHVIAWSERSLRRHLRQNLVCCHEWRTHLSLDNDAPVPQ